MIKLIKLLCLKLFTFYINSTFLCCANFWVLLKYLEGFNNNSRQQMSKAIYHIVRGGLYFEPRFPFYQFSNFTIFTFSFSCPADFFQIDVKFCFQFFKRIFFGLQWIIQSFCALWRVPCSSLWQNILTKRFVRSFVRS